MNKNKNTNKKNSLISIIVVIGLVFFINIISQNFFFRLDFTTDKRFSLKEETISLLQNKLDKPLYFEIYLDGEFPSDLQKLRRAIQEKLDEYKIYAGDNIQYQFINPFEDDTKKKEVFQELKQKGLYPVTYSTKDEGNLTKHFAYPGAVIRYGLGEEKSLMFMNTASNKMAMLQKVETAINDLEYNLNYAIRKVITPVAKKIVFLEGHGELDKHETWSIEQRLSEFYQVDRLAINNNIHALDFIDLLVIAKPMKPFTEKDKYIIDQFIMSGKKVIWMVDGIQMQRDSLLKNFETQGLALDVNLRDQLFKYGARINNDAILDQTCSPIYSTYHKDVMPWNFYPMLLNRNFHPIINNIDPIKTEYISTVDTIETPQITKTPLLMSSGQTLVQKPVLRINFGIVEFYNNGKPFSIENNKPFQKLGWLLEGEFESLFKGRLSKQYKDQSNKTLIREKSRPTKMIVIGDGDIIKNEVRVREENGAIRREYLPIYANPFGITEIRYGNQNFFMNAVDYLLGEEGLISSRSVITVRHLDKQKVTASKTSWTIFNIAFPPFLILLFGSVIYFIRKKKYGK